MTLQRARPGWRTGPLLAWGMALLLPACSATPGPGQPPSGGCEAQAAQHLVGQRGTEALGEQARQLAGARRVRLYGPNDAITRDHDLQRLNLALDAQGRIARIVCG